MSAVDNKKTKFHTGDLIMEQGTIGDCAYIIDSGLVEIFIDHVRLGLAMPIAYRSSKN